MNPQYPSTPEELADALASASSRSKSITLGGRFTKQKMAGPVPPTDTIISTQCLNRVLQYEPEDLTISVEAGLPFSELSGLLASNRQMVPLDPTYADQATVGGVVAANVSGPRRRLYGTARDFVIGMKFATLEGKLVQSGGMVVKNVAGLDMAKLMIGSFGTLAAIAVVNLKLVPMPAFSRSFLHRFRSLSAAIAMRDSILKSVLQPQAIDLLNPEAAARLGGSGYVLAMQAGGNAAVIERYTRELSDAGILEGAAEESFWAGVREFVPRFLEEHPEGAVVRVSCTVSQLAAVFEWLDVPVVGRAGSGVCYACFANWEAAGAAVKEAAVRGWKAVVEFAPPERKGELELWPSPGGNLGIMRRVKEMFDPHRLLNRGRLYGRI